MNKAMRASLDDVRSEDRARQNKAFTDVLRATEKPVDWAYEVWDEMVSALRHADNHVRAISAQVLCSLPLPSITLESRSRGREVRRLLENPVEPSIVLNNGTARGSSRAAEVPRRAP